jgi:hypothetical protein
MPRCSADASVSRYLSGETSSNVTCGPRGASFRNACFTALVGKCMSPEVDSTPLRNHSAVPEAGPCGLPLFDKRPFCWPYRREVRRTGRMPPRFRIPNISDGPGAPCAPIKSAATGP